MGRTELLKQAAEYKEAVKITETKKPFSLIMDFEGGKVEYNPETDWVEIKHGGNKIRIPGTAIHSLRMMLEKLDG